MRATDVISLAIKISRTKNKARKHELALSCPEAFRELLRSNLKLIATNQKLKAHRDRTRAVKASYRYTYKFSPLPESIKNKPTTAAYKTALNNCNDLRAMLGGQRESV